MNKSLTAIASTDPTDRCSSGVSLIVRHVWFCASSGKQNDAQTDAMDRPIVGKRKNSHPS